MCCNAHRLLFFKHTTTIYMNILASISLKIRRNYRILRRNEWYKLTAQVFGKFFETFRQFPLSSFAIGYLFITMAFCYWPISHQWIFGFMMMTLPFAVLTGLAASAYLVFKKQRVLASTGFIWLLLAFPIMKRLVGNGSEKLFNDNRGSLKVLSFNSASFSGFPSDFKNWADLKADIACFQEYIPNAKLESQYAQKAECTNFQDGQNRTVGLALLSQYPIVKQYGKIWSRPNAPNVNGFLYADIVYHQDTVRIVNTHFWSMGVRIENAYEALRKGDIRTFGRELSDTFTRLKDGFKARNEQIEEVEQYVAGSRYPVIICGDFNETPFGYAYGKLSLTFQNAFEEAGQGLGFTLNRNPYFVRIDQQFFSSDWEVKSCKTVSSVPFSDHFPLVAQYVLSKSTKDIGLLALNNR